MDGRERRSQRSSSGGGWSARSRRSDESGPGCGRGRLHGGARCSLDLAEQAHAGADVDRVRVPAEDVVDDFAVPREGEGREEAQASERERGHGGNLVVGGKEGVEMQDRAITAERHGEINAAARGREGDGTQRWELILDDLGLCVDGHPALKDEEIAQAAHVLAHSRVVPLLDDEHVQRRRGELQLAATGKHRTRRKEHGPERPS